MPRDDITSAILRFRDLNTAAGVTIGRHAAIAASGHVWWGWWSKSGERVPLEALAALTARARKEGLPLLLFDSGALALHRAVCTEIHYDRAGDEIETPDPAHTPEYYAQTKPCRAWFRLERLEAAPVEDPRALLHGLSYVRVDELFTDGASRYDKFYGKRIASIDELLQQNRTLWFVRPTRPEDPTHEISLLDAHALAPEHFASRFHQSSSRTLLWLSDLHFGHHAFPTEPGTVADPLSRRIQDALAKETGIAEVAGLILSGDLTWQATPDEYARTGRFIEDVRSWSNLRSHQIAVCPGNHDLRFSADPAKKDAPVTVARPDAVAAYADFYRSHFSLAPNEHLTMGRRFLLGGEVPVEVVCLNSSLLEQKPGQFQGHGFLGQAQLDAAAAAMGWDGRSRVGPVRIVVVHHHLLPVTYREEPVEGWTYSVVLDAEALVRWIVRHRVRVVLHGHMHQPFYSRIARRENFLVAKKKTRPHTFHVLGMGSTGVSKDHLGETPHNMFATLTLTRGRLEVAYYAVHRTNQPHRLGRLSLDLWPEDGVSVRARRAGRPTKRDRR